MKVWEETWTRDHNSAGRWQITQRHSEGWRRVAQFENPDFDTDADREFVKAHGRTRHGRRRCAR